MQQTPINIDLLRPGPIFRPWPGGRIPDAKTTPTRQKFPMGTSHTLIVLVVVLDPRVVPAGHQSPITNSPASLRGSLASLETHKNPYKIRLWPAWPAWQDRKALAGGRFRRHSILPIFHPSISHDFPLFPVFLRFFPLKCFSRITHHGSSHSLTLLPSHVLVLPPRVTALDRG